jgi:hypothetical protein
MSSRELVLQSYLVYDKILPEIEIYLWRELLKITMQDNEYVRLANGDLKTHNELIWNYRSECCGASLALASNGRFICKLCEHTLEGVVGKNLIHKQLEDLQKTIEVLPGEIKQAAQTGFYLSMEQRLDNFEDKQRVLSSRITHIMDGVKGVKHADKGIN